MSRVRTPPATCQPSSPLGNKLPTVHKYQAHHNTRPVPQPTNSGRTAKKLSGNQFLRGSSLDEFSERFSATLIDQADKLSQFDG